MNIPKSYTLYLIVIGVTCPMNLNAFSFKRLSALVGKLNYEAIIEKEFHLEKGILTINNMHGNIEITTEWKRNTVCVKALKKAIKEEDLEVFDIKSHHQDLFDGPHLTLETTCAHTGTKGAIDYHVIVPAHVSLQLHTDNGSITINEVHGPIAATTVNGDISMKNVSNMITAQTEVSGTISIENAKGVIKATTKKGDIVISGAEKSILANTQKGNIITTCNNVPSKSKIVLNSETKGTITLSLPSATNATLLGQTKRGYLSSDHYVTIKPFTTKLNRKFHKEFERKVDGILGSGEADIRLTSNNGNIKILETKVA